MTVIELNIANISTYDQGFKKCIYCSNYYSSYHYSSFNYHVKVNNVRDALIVKKSYWLVKTSDINTKSVFISSATTCYNCGDCGHLT
jgi:hypothetical protein